MFSFFIVGLQSATVRLIEELSLGFRFWANFLFTGTLLTVRISHVRLILEYAIKGRQAYLYSALACSTVVVCMLLAGR